MPNQKLDVLISLKALEVKLINNPKDKDPSTYLSCVVRRGTQQRMETSKFKHINLKKGSKTEIDNN